MAAKEAYSSSRGQDLNYPILKSGALFLQALLHLATCKGRLQSFRKSKVDFLFGDENFLIVDPLFDELPPKQNSHDFSPDTSRLTADWPSG
jgi:hypothetical protein